jgi:hypothetical protein
VRLIAVAGNCFCSCNENQIIASFEYREGLPGACCATLAKFPSRAYTTCGQIQTSSLPPVSFLRLHAYTSSCSRYLNFQTSSFRLVFQSQSCRTASRMRLCSNNLLSRYLLLARFGAGYNGRLIFLRWNNTLIRSAVVRICGT